MEQQFWSAFIGAVSALIVAYAKSIIDFKKEISAELLDKRFEAYQGIWSMTQLLPKWPRAEDVTYDLLRNFSKELQDWYFRTGGWLLSIKSREAYGNLQDAIQAVLGSASNLNDSLDKNHYDVVQRSCSLLRTQLTTDLQSRTRK